MIKKADILIFVFIVLGLWTASLKAARIINVDDDGPADFNNIQEAIDDSSDGDTIIVADGIYTGQGNRDIDFLGKVITVRSENGPENCIIDCNATESDRHRGFFLHSGEDANSAIIGFTITNGCAPVIWIPPPVDGYLSEGGAILLDYSSPTISNCIITDNFAGIGYVYGYGGGIYIRGGSPAITNCIISRNLANRGGGGICINRGSPAITNCIFSRNLANSGGGGIYSGEGGPTITNCTFSGNQTNERCAGGILCGHGSITVTNCILWGNIGSGGEDAYAQFCYVVPTAVFLNYYCIQGYPGSLNPLFADANNDDYHLKSQAGRWDPNSKSWVQDEVTSPCIDAGNPYGPVGLEPFPNGGIINIGAYGGTIEASKSYFGKPPCEIIVAGDVNGDCVVNFLDFRIMAFHWCEDNRQ